METVNTILMVLAKIIDYITEPKVLSGLAVLAFIVIAVWRTMSGENPLEWWHFISSKGADGKDYADIDKLGKVVALFISSWVMMVMTFNSKMDAMMMMTYLAYAGAVGGWSAYLRARTGAFPAGAATPLNVPPPPVQ